MDEAGFEDKFIAFIDILGFKSMVVSAEQGRGRSLAEIHDLATQLGRPDYDGAYAQDGPMICPYSAVLRRDLNFQVTQVSDCVIVSAEVSPAGVINLIDHCASVVIKLMTKGVMVRGYVTRGMVYHRGSAIYGSGYQDAYDKAEKGVIAFKLEADEKGTPFVEVDPSVRDFVAHETDECVREMFGRMTASDGDVTAVFPFRRFAHSVVIGGPRGEPFDPVAEKARNDGWRRQI